MQYTLNEFKSIDVDKMVFVLEMSNNCKMNCKYCFYDYDKNVEKSQLSTNSLDDFLNLLTELSKEKHISLDIQYDGNEKHLFEILRSIFAKYLYHIDLNIQSSGLGVSEKLLSYLKYHDIRISFSFDGYFNGMRKNSVALNAMKLAKNNEVNFGIITVVSKENENRLYGDFRKLVVEFPDSFRGIYYNPIYSSDISQFPNANTVLKNYKQIYNYIVKHNLYISFSPLEKIFRRIFYKNACLCDDGGCGAYRRIFAVSHDYKIFGCDSLIRKHEGCGAECRQKLVIDVNDMFNLVNCKICKYFEICDKFCYGKYVSTEKNIELLKLLCSYNKQIVDLAMNIYDNSELQARLFLYKKTDPLTEKYYFESPILKLNSDLNKIIIDENLINIKDGYLKHSFFTKNKDKLDYTPESLLQVLHNISESLVPKFFNSEGNQILKFYETKSYIYITSSMGSYAGLKDYYLNKLLAEDYKCFYNLKIESKYFFDKLEFLLKHPTKSSDYYTAVISTYVNLNVRVLLFKLLHKELDNRFSQNNNLDFDVGCFKYNLKYNLDLDEYRLRLMQIKKPIPQKIDLNKIIKQRKKILKKDLRSYFLFDMVDTVFYFADSMHGLTNKMLFVFNAIGFPNKLDYFNVDFEELKLNNTAMSDFLFYDSIGYKYGLFDEQNYKLAVMRFIGKKQILISDIINKYPLLSPDLLR